MDLNSHFINVSPRLVAQIDVYSNLNPIQFITRSISNSSCVVLSMPKKLRI